MKKIVIGIVACCSFTMLPGQETTSSNDHKAQYFRASIGASAGMNNFSGIVGITGEYQLARKFAMNVGLGYSYWGTLGSVGIRYYDNYPHGFSFLLAFNHAFGMKKVDLSLQTVQDSTVVTSFRYDPASSVQLALAYHWQTGKSNRFYVEAGYAFKLWTEPYEILSPDNTRLSDNSRKLVEFRPPGGIVIGLGYIFGFGY